MTKCTYLNHRPHIHKYTIIGSLEQKDLYLFLSVYWHNNSGWFLRTKTHYLSCNSSLLLSIRASVMHFQIQALFISLVAIQVEHSIAPSACLCLRWESFVHQANINFTFWHFSGNLGGRQKTMGKTIILLSKPVGRKID